MSLAADAHLHSQIHYERVGGIELEIQVRKLEDSVIITAKDKLFRPLGSLVLDLSKGVIWNLLVDTEYRRKGIATFLIEKAECMTREAGLDRLQADTHSDNIAARRLFKKLGYFEMVAMEKRL